MTNSSLPESLELFLFDFCPFAQRVQISLLQGELPYQAITLNPAKMPDDFATISPLGNVPILRVNTTETIFESAVINDYIAQISSISMEPSSELQRAQMRAWSEYSSGCFMALMQLLQAKDKEAFKQANATLISKFTILSKQLLTDGPYFYGQQFTTIDATYAPLFLRMQTIKSLFNDFSLTDLPENIVSWMLSLLECESVKKSVMGDFTAIYSDFIHKKSSGKYLESHLN